MLFTKIRGAWSQAVIDKNIKAIMSIYDRKAIFKGTYMKTPVKDRELLKDYFTNFAPIVKNIVFAEDNVVIKNDKTISEIGNYKFYTTKGVLNAQYNFVYSIEKNKILSHFSTLRK